MKFLWTAHPDKVSLVVAPESNLHTKSLLGNPKSLRNDMSITFLQQILSGKLLLVVIVGAKK